MTYHRIPFAVLETVQDGELCYALPAPLLALHAFASRHPFRHVRLGSKSPCIQSSLHSVQLHEHQDIASTVFASQQSCHQAASTYSSQPNESKLLSKLFCVPFFTPFPLELVGQEHHYPKLVCSKSGVGSR